MLSRRIKIHKNSHCIISDYLSIYLSIIYLSVTNDSKTSCFNTTDVITAHGFVGQKSTTEWLGGVSGSGVAHDVVSKALSVYSLLQAWLGARDPLLM